jgi:hypothetical protein
MSKPLPLDPTQTCGKDERFSTDLPSSIAFRFRGRNFFLLADDPDESDAHYVLKRRMIVTHRIIEMEREGCGVYLCRLAGSDGSELELHITAEDIHHNIAVTQETLQEVQYTERVC